MAAQLAGERAIAGRNCQQSPVARRLADHHTQPARAVVARAIQEEELPERKEQQAEGQSDSGVAWHRQRQQAQQEQQGTRELGEVRLHLFPCQRLGLGLRSSAVKHRRWPCLRAWREESGL